MEREIEYLSLSLTRRYPLVLRSASGSFLEDVDGNVYLDFDAGNGTLILGHQNPDVLEALKDQIDSLISEPCPDLTSAIAVDLGERLIRTFGKGYEEFYERVRNYENVRFIRGSPMEILQDADGS
ncbi:MAG: aminotransferase class III-fold pyridoxal phosphate-dependent enzyme, partial [Candidatus Bathyarchaeia archaeon]